MITSRTITAFCLGVLSPILVMISVAPAHASPDTFFLECLTQNGVEIKNTEHVLELGAAIQTDLNNGITQNYEVADLTRRGLDPDIAQIDVMCAWRTWNNHGGTSA